MKKTRSFLRNALQAIVAGRSRQARRYVDTYLSSRGLTDKRGDE